MEWVIGVGRDAIRCAPKCIWTSTADHCLPAVMTSMWFLDIWTKNWPTLLGFRSLHTSKSAWFLLRAYGRRGLCSLKWHTGLECSLLISQLPRQMRSIDCTQCPITAEVFMAATTQPIACTTNMPPGSNSTTLRKSLQTKCFLLSNK